MSQKGKHESGNIGEYILPDNSDSIIAEQKRCIKLLKEDNQKMEQRLALLEKERNDVLSVLDMTQKNSEEIIHEASCEAQIIIAEAREKAEQMRQVSDFSINEILETEETLTRVLELISQLKTQFTSEKKEDNASAT